MGISLGLVGLGSFGSAFAKLFKAHPAVSRIGLCDCEKTKLEKFANDPFMQDKLSKKDLFLSLDDICKADFDAIAIITQPWLHAPQCLKVLESGKSVYSAVPVISLPDGEEILDWCGKLREAVKRTGRHYRPCSAAGWPRKAASATSSTPKESTPTTWTLPAPCAW